jgi:hypothetical protein
MKRPRKAKAVARKRSRQPVNAYRMSTADRLCTFDHLESGADLSVRIIDALNDVLRDAINANEAKRAATALIVGAALWGLKIEIGTIRLQASRLRDDAMLAAR